MPDTTNRPTPEDLIAAALWGQDVGKVSAGELQRRIVDCLVRTGYVIVHPDDVPVRTGAYDEFGLIDWEIGWNDCRANIFGPDA